MGLSQQSIGGLDGNIGVFYQDTWDIIGEDACKMVVDFFCGYELPRFTTHTNFILLPKNVVVNRFLDLRPISFNNFVNKIFSRITSWIKLKKAFFDRYFYPGVATKGSNHQLLQT